MLDELIAGMLVAGRYRLENRFATGAWGSLWHARDESTHLSCTVRLADSGVTDLRGMRERFAREVQAAEALRCENVVNLIGHGEWSGMPYVVFEALQGEDLARRLNRERRLPPAEVLEIVSDVAHALGRAHELGIVHRDLKPENIFMIRVGANEVAKVLNFGVTGGGPGSSLDRATKVGHHLGLPFYTSPEQATAQPVDLRADLWALGAIAFHCLTGRPPFESNSLDELLTQLGSAPLPRIQELDPDLPESLDTWCENALSRDPELRFQSAEELAGALAHAFQRTTLTGHPSPDWRTRRGNRLDSTNDLTWLAAVPDASAQTADSFSEAPMSEQRAQWRLGRNARRRVLRVSVGAVFSLLLLTLGVSLLRQGTPPGSVATVGLEQPKSSPRATPMPATPEPAKPAQAPVEAPAAHEPGAARSELGPTLAQPEPASMAATAEAPATAPTISIVPESIVPCQAPPAVKPAEPAARPVRPRLPSDDGASLRATRRSDPPKAPIAPAEPDYGI
jgi:serine/threonine-protein kinase